MPMNHMESGKIDWECELNEFFYNFSAVQFAFDLTHSSYQKMKTFKTQSMFT